MLLEKKILALREELEEREAAMQVDSTWWKQLHSCHAFDRRLRDEGTVSLGRCVAIYSETKTEGSGNKSFRHLHLPSAHQGTGDRVVAGGEESKPCLWKHQLRFGTERQSKLVRPLLKIKF